jgi:allantoate deiminase
MHRRRRGILQDDGAGLVGTVGAITALPGATNVIPGRVSFTLDIRAPTDAHRKLAVADIVRRSRRSRSGANCRCRSTSPTKTAPCPARHG